MRDNDWVFKWAKGIIIGTVILMAIGLIGGLATWIYAIYIASQLIK